MAGNANSGNGTDRRGGGSIRKNISGPKSDKIWADAIRMAVHRYHEERGPDGKKKKTRYLNLLADKLVEKGAAGDVNALKEIADRLDGKAPQYMEMAGKDGAPLAQPVINVSIDGTEPAPAPKAGNGADHHSD